MKSLTLCRSDLTDNEAITYEQCRAVNLRLSLKQPDSELHDSALHCCGSRASVNGCSMMEVWDLNLLIDFKADLTDILSMRWQSEDMSSMKVTHPYVLLVAVGLRADTMHMFGYTMLSWINLGSGLEAPLLPHRSPDHSTLRPHAAGSRAVLHTLHTVTVEEPVLMTA